MESQQTHANQSIPKTISATEQDQMERKHLFCINGMAEFLEILRHLFEDEQYNVTTTNYVPNTFEQIEALQPDAIILDLAINHQAAWPLLEQLASEASTHDIPVIIVSTDWAMLDEASFDPARYGGKAYLVKPFDLEVLLGMIHDLVGAS